MVFKYTTKEKYINSPKPFYASKDTTYIVKELTASDGVFARCMSIRNLSLDYIKSSSNATIKNSQSEKEGKGFE
jgi:hypothetical protein